MDRSQLVAWRKNLGLTQQQAADILGVHRATFIDYEKGVRRSDKKPVDVPKSIELACQAIKLGFREYTEQLFVTVAARDNADYVIWSEGLLRKPDGFLLENGRKQFPEHWKSYPYAFVPNRKYMSDEEREKLKQEMLELHDVSIDWVFLPVATNEKEWIFMAPTIVVQSMNEVFYLAVKFHEPRQTAR